MGEWNVSSVRKLMADPEWTKAELDGVMASINLVAREGRKQKYLGKVSRGIVKELQRRGFAVTEGDDQRDGCWTLVDWSVAR